ncbi:MAG: hypothetical protein IJH45_07370, partial [Firmicutes bacterium]|nr:hypothetical protein [Bacillota bacterium]
FDALPPPGEAGFAGIDGKGPFFSHGRLRRIGSAFYYAGRAAGMKRGKIKTRRSGKQIRKTDFPMICRFIIDYSDRQEMF